MIKKIQNVHHLCSNPFDGSGVYNLFYSTFGEYANTYRLRVKDGFKYDNDVIYKYCKEKYNKSYVEQKQTGVDAPVYQDMILVGDKHMVSIESSGQYIVFYYHDIFPSEILEELKKEKYYKSSVHKKELTIIVPSSGGLSTHDVELSRTEFDISNYNEDFLPIHENIIKNLQENKSGLYLFYGMPGAGKSSYIASLTSNKLINKKFIYLPSQYLTSMDNPDFLGMLTRNTNSVLIIEDGERVLVDRDEESQSPIGALLNMSDGLLGQVLKCQIICTFNTDIRKIDKALYRKGRLICEYEFKELETSRANELAKFLNKDVVFDKPTVLSDIYNCEVNGSKLNKKVSSIGFGKY